MNPLDERYLGGYVFFASIRCELDCTKMMMQSKESDRFIKTIERTITEERKNEGTQGKQSQA